MIFQANIRPYQMWPHGPWIDLNHVQQVNPPMFIDRMGFGGYFVEMTVELAFRDQPRVFKFYQEAGEYNPNREQPRPKVYDDGWPTELKHVVHAVYYPLVLEWTGQVVILGGPAVYGYDANVYARRGRGKG